MSSSPTSVRNRKKKKLTPDGELTDTPPNGEQSCDGATSTVPPSQTVIAPVSPQVNQPSQTQQTSVGPHQQVTYTEEKVIIFEIPQKWFIILMVLLVSFFGCVSVLIAVGRKDPTLVADDLAHNIGTDGVLLFQQHDRDGDGYLSIEEFEPLVYRLLETNLSGPIYDVPIEENDSIVTLRTYFEPIVMDTMSKDMNEVLPGSMNSLHGLEKWKNASLQWMNFGASHFAGFLPKDVDNIVLGKSYFIIEVQQGFFEGLSLSSNRYYPPRVSNNESILIHRLLTLFHPRPFVISRFASQGSVACVRAYNDKYIEIIFRIHAEFQLNEPPYHPFWFTPAQFTGNLIITRDASEVFYFNMYVPNDKRLNVDMEWLNGPKESENMEVDIGYMPLMQVNMSQPSVALKELKEYELLEPLPEVPDHKRAAENVDWNTEISLEDAKRSLEVTLYPFKQVPYFNFTNAFEKANEEHKLVHSVLLWGALDDQSC